MSHFNEYEIDLHIKVTDSYYDGDHETEVTVIYPSRLHHAVTVEYSGEFTERVAKDACTDIAAYIQDPGSWITTYINERSTNTKRKLLEAKTLLKEYQERIDTYQLRIRQDQEWLAKTGAEIARLQAMIEEEEARE